MKKSKKLAAGSGNVLVHLVQTSYCGKLARISVENQMAEHIAKVLKGEARGPMIGYGGGGTHCWDDDKTIRICPDCGAPCNEKLI